MKYTVIIFLFTMPIFCQERVIKVVDYHTGEPIENVNVYIDSQKVAKTNTKGVFTLKKDEGAVILVKENYVDTLINAKNNLVKLQKIKEIQLEEVVVTGMSSELILEKTFKNIAYTKQSKDVENFHFKNISTIDKDTLVYMDEILHWNNKNDVYIDKNAKIINNFEIKEGNALYKINAKEIIFNAPYTFSRYDHTINLREIIRYGKNNFIIDIEKDENYYKISFKPKKKKQEYPYRGYIIVNADDFKIYEFSLENAYETKRNLMFKGKIINFKVIEEREKMIFEKKENGSYSLMFFSSNTRLEILDGDFKGKTFKNECFKKNSMVGKNSNTRKFDMDKYKIMDDEK